MSEQRLARGWLDPRRLAVLLALLVVASDAPLAQPSESPSVLVGRYEMDGVRRPLVTVWHLRGDGSRLMGTTLGSVDSRLIEGGLLDGRSVSFTLRERVDGTIRDLAFAGRWNGRRMAGTLSGPSGTGRLVLRAATTAIVERGLVFAETDASGNPVGVVWASIALDADKVVAGRFVNSEDACPSFGCEGEVLALRERTTSRRTRLTVRLRSDDDCPVETEIDANFDAATLLYSGSFSSTDCRGSRGGSLIAARTNGTRSDHASQILAGLGRVADDLEGDAPFVTPHPSFSPHYLHGSRTLAGLFADFEDERRRYTMRRASFNAIRSVKTIPDPLALPGLGLPPPGVEFDQIREGVPRAGGPRERYVDTATIPVPPRLSVWAEEAGRWVISGDRFSMELPFPYAATADALEVATPGGTVWVSPGPFGAHTGPHTGHVNGDAKANFIGYMSDGDSDMVDLGNGNGVREPGERWGYYGGIAGERIRNRIPTYVAPADAVLEEIRFQSGPTGMYFDDVPHWNVSMRFPEGSTLNLGHLGYITPNLQHRVLSELGIDLGSYTGPPGVVVPRESGLRLRAGEPLAQPQVMASEYADRTGYFRGPGPTDVPWAQMEFQFVTRVAGPVSADACVYEHIPRPAHEQIQSVLDAQMADVTSLRFGPYRLERWLWSAEGRACLAYTNLPDDFSSLDTRLGGWFEQPQTGVPSDELVAFVRITRDTASFDATLYDPRNVGFLLRRQRAFGVQWNWLMPDGTTARPFYPAGELLERGASTLLVKWRDVGYRDASGVPRPVYQWASYVLDATTGLKIHWGPFLNDPADGGPPPLSPATPCTGTSVVCYDHVERPGY